MFTKTTDNTPVNKKKKTNKVRLSEKHQSMHASATGTVESQIYR